MTENYKVPLKYKEGTYKVDEIVNFSGEIIYIKYEHSEMYSYIVPEYNHEVYLYVVKENHIFTATYDSNGIIKYIELHRENKTELVYINLPDMETAKEYILKYSCFWGDRISEKILGHKEKIARLFIDYSDDWYQVGILVNAYAQEDVQQAIDDYNEYLEKYKLSRDDYHAEDESRNYRKYVSESITPDIETLQKILLCTNPDFADELYKFAVNIIIEKIKNNVIDKINKTEDFRFISAPFYD